MSRHWMIVIAVLCGLAGTALIMYTNRLNEAPVDSGATVGIVAAGQDLEMGTVLQEKHLRELTVSEALADRTSDLMKWENKARFVGGILNVPLDRGTPILVPNVHGFGTEGGLSKMIGGGKWRAMSINVSGSTGVSGLLYPGCRVDIIAMYTRTIAEEKQMTGRGMIIPLLQDVFVLAVGDRTMSQRDDVRTSYSTITVQVTLAEAQVLIAASRGSLHCVLRSPESDTVNPVDVEKELSAALSKENIAAMNLSRQGIIIAAPPTDRRPLNK